MQTRKYFLKSHPGNLPGEIPHPSPKHQAAIGSYHPPSPLARLPYRTGSAAPGPQRSTSLRDGRQRERGAGYGAR